MGVDKVINKNPIGDLSLIIKDQRFPHNKDVGAGSTSLCNYARRERKKGRSKTLYLQVSQEYTENTKIL